MKVLCENISKRFGSVYVLQDISFSLESSKGLAVLGQNSAGKTTLLKIIATILKPTSGNLVVNGIDVIRYPGRIRKILGYVSETPSLIEELDASSNLKHFASIKGVSKQRVSHLIEKLKIPQVRKPVRFLSKGMRQRISLAVAILNFPRLVILDEPTDGLDTESSHLIWSMIQEMKKNGTAVIVSTHDEREARDLCEKMLILENGRCVFYGNVKGFYKRFKRLYEVEIAASEQSSSTNGKTELRLVSEQRLTEVLSSCRVVGIRTLGFRETLSVTGRDQNSK